MKKPNRIPTVIHALAAALILFVPAITRSETAVVGWVQRWNGTGNNTDTASAVAVDANNNVIVTGTSLGSGSSFDYVTIQYSSMGVSLWTKRYNGPDNGSDGAAAIAVDNGNNVIVTGHSQSSTTNDYVTIQYSSAGVPLWTNRYNGPGGTDDQACAVAVDHSNNVNVTGFSGDDYLTIQYSNAGVPLWTNRYNGLGNGWDKPVALAIDANNNVIVTGYSQGISSSSDYVTIQYSSAGLPLWTNRYNGPANSIDWASALVVDCSNNVIVTGRSIGSRGYYDFGTIKYSSAGLPLWTNHYNDPAGTSCYASAVAVDSKNNVFVTGDAYLNSYQHYTTIAYSSTGEPMWTNRYNGPATGADVPRAVVVDYNDNVIVTGYSQGDYGTVKYSNAGIPIWTNRYDGPAHGGDSPSALAMVLDRNGDVILTGQSDGGGSGFDYTTIKLLSAPVMHNAPMTNGIFQMQLRPPNTVVIEASTNLVGWRPIFTNSSPTNLLFYRDAESSSHHRRFYRAVRVP